MLALQAAPGEAAYAPAGVLGKTGGGVFRFPQAIAFDASGVDDPGAGAPGGPYLYVADQHSILVQKFTTDGTSVRRIGGFGTGAGRFGRVSPAGIIGGVGGLAVGPRGALYVLDSFNSRRRGRGERRLHPGRRNRSEPRPRDRPDRGDLRHGQRLRGT
ncbi:MAG: hypothetical protein H0V22_05480 [Solirubrobacterales bacterium]|nr:hypothetical protein [Solirubrobacterales bacterium]